MVTCREQLLHPQDGADIQEELGCELRTVVGQQVYGSPVRKHTVFAERFRDRWRTGVRQRYGARQLTEAISKDE